MRATVRQILTGNNLRLVILHYCANRAYRRSSLEY
jgi:hypothetical protein